MNSKFVRCTSNNFSKMAKWQANMTIILQFVFIFVICQSFTILILMQKAQNSLLGYPKKQRFIMGAGIICSYSDSGVPKLHPRRNFAPKLPPGTTSPNDNFTPATIYYKLLVVERGSSSGGELVWG